MCCSVFMFYNMFLNIAPFQVFLLFAAICHYTTEMNFERYFSFRNSGGCKWHFFAACSPNR